jgi:Protein of unknown function (DUF2600)
VGALHSLLDQLVDVSEDARTGQRNLIACYSSLGETAERMALLASRSLSCARELHPPARHELIVASMASFYLSSPEAFVGDASVVSRAVLDELGPLASPALGVFRVRRAVSMRPPARFRLRNPTFVGVSPAGAKLVGSSGG